MKIIYKDPKGRELKMLINNLDDLWHLSNVLEKNDLVYSITYRREEKQDDKLRAERAEKKKVRIGLRVDNWKYHDFADILRIHGIIEEGPFDLGSHHTLNIGLDTTLSVVKERWRDYQLEQLQEAVSASRQPIVTFVSIDDERAQIATLHQYGINPRGVISGPGHGKAYKGKEDAMNEFYGQILSHLKQTYNPNSPLILIGPAFYKDDFIKFGKDREPDLFGNSAIENTNSVGMEGIQEALKRGAVTRIVRNARVGLETEMVEKLLTEIAKNGLYSYGYDELNKALDMGAADHLLITNEFMRTTSGIELMNKAKSTGAKIMVISTVHEAGKKLSGFGGVAAILRFKLD